MPSPPKKNYVKFLKIINNNNVEDKYKCHNQSETMNIPSDQLNPVALYRLMKLTGLKNTPEDGKIITEALQMLASSFIREFNEGTSGSGHLYLAGVENQVGIGYRQ